MVPVSRSNSRRWPRAIEFVKLEIGKTYDIAGAKVRGILQLHGNDSYGYRIEKDGKAVIYTTDSEHKPQDKAEMERVAKFFGGADLVIFDAMYSLADTVSVKEDWGHSSNIMGVELCQMGAVKTALPVPSRTGLRRPSAGGNLQGNLALRGDHASGQEAGCGDCL